MKPSQKNMKLSILLVLFGISQVFGKIPLEQGACVEGAYCKFTLISNDKSTGKSLSEAFIFASTNPQYDDILFIELQVQYIHENSKLGTWGEHVVYRN